MGNIPWDTLYNVAMDQYSKGINMLIPHAVWFNDRDVTFEPELSHRNRLYNQGLYEFNTFLARLNMLLRNDDRFVTDVAMLYPIETMQGEHYFDGPLGAYAGGVKIPDMDYVQISQRLTNELGRDFQFLHPEVLQDACRVDKNGLTLANTKQYNTFRTLIVPSSKTISVAESSQNIDLLRSRRPGDLHNAIAGQVDRAECRRAGRSPDGQTAAGKAAQQRRAPYESGGRPRRFPRQARCRCIAQRAGPSVGNVRRGISRRHRTDALHP